MVAAIRGYRGLLREREEAERLRADPEMRGLADEELERIRRGAARGRAGDAAGAAAEGRRPTSARRSSRSAPGTGGEEAALFAADLARMYQRLAEARGWRWEVVEAAPTELGG